MYFMRNANRLLLPWARSEARQLAPAGSDRISDSASRSFSDELKDSQIVGEANPFLASGLLGGSRAYRHLGELLEMASYYRSFSPRDQP